MGWLVSWLVVGCYMSWLVDGLVTQCAAKVTGGAGDYFDVAHAVVLCEGYLPQDATAEAKQIASELPSQRVEVLLLLVLLLLLDVTHQLGVIDCCRRVVRSLAPLLRGHR